MPYLVHRIILSCDEFDHFSTMYVEGSAGIVCVFLVGLPPELRCSCRSVRVLSLIHTGISSNQVLSFVLDSLFGGTVNGIDGTPPDVPRAISSSMYSVSSVITPLLPIL